MPAIDVDGTTVVSVGRVFRQAAILDEPFSESSLWATPERAVAEIRLQGLPADTFTFAPPLDLQAQRLALHCEIDNAAVIDTTNVAAWWESLPQSTRKNCRRAERRGVTTTTVSFDRALCAGIKAIYDESPIRQGRRFWHFGKSLDDVARENGTYAERAEFIGSYLGTILIGFVKIVYVGRVARIMQILAAQAQAERRPMNALIAKAVEAAAARGMRYLVYSKFDYGNSGEDPLKTFKERNGFSRLEYPRYYVPVTRRGRICTACRLHRGAAGLAPAPALRFARAVRNRLNAVARPRAKDDAGVAQW